MPQDYSLHDPPLSELGLRQCEDLSRNLQDLDIARKIELIIVSPMRRTLQTAQLGLGWLIHAGVPMQLRGEWQENSDNPCDTGTSLSILSSEFPNLNFSTVFSEYPEKTGRWAFTQAAIIQRGIDCRRWLKARPEKVIAVVTHSGFLRVAISYSRYVNADYRVFDFAHEGDELVEWPMTEEKGGGMGASPKGRACIEAGDFPNERKETVDEAVGEAPA